jgi:hypothetical protein
LKVKNRPKNDAPFPPQGAKRQRERIASGFPAPAFWACENLLRESGTCLDGRSFVKEKLDEVTRKAERLVSNPGLRRNQLGGEPQEE